MAIYFLNLTTIGRSSGSSAVSAAAYRSGERIHDERSGRTYDHSGRQDVLHKEIMLPNQFAGADMSWAQDRGYLWNTAERAEVRSDARVAREYLVALPAELSPQGRINLVAEFSRELVERYRFALDIAIHAPRDYPGSDPRNFHAHLLATTREVTRDGLGAKTALEWSDTHRRQAGLGRALGELLHVRERWALAANTALEQERINQRIDHRSLKAQGIDREPKPYIPRAAFEMERRGHRSAVAERIRAQYQGRVQARLQGSAHERSAAGPKSLTDKVKEAARSWFRSRLVHREPQSKSSRDPAKGVARARTLEQQAPQETRRQNVATQAEQGRAVHHRAEREAQSKTSDDGSNQAVLNWAEYRRAQGPQKSPDEQAKESLRKWAEYRQAQGPQKSPDEQAKESLRKWAEYRQAQVAQGAAGGAREAALRWAAQYGPEARALREKQGQGQQTPERKQHELAPDSANRARGLDLSL